MKKKTIISIALFSIIAVGIGINSVWPVFEFKNFSTKDTTELKEDFNNTLKSNFEFSLLANANEKQPNQNVCLSPLSFSMALLIAYNGAEGQTKKELGEALRIGNKNINEINQSAKKTLDALNIEDNTTILNVLNSVWANNKLKNDNVFSNYSAKLKDFGLADTNLVDFNNSQGSANRINRWVNANTRGRISGIVNSENITNDLAVMIINTVYFKGKWKEPFKKVLTKTKDFYSNNGKTSCMMMKQKDDYSYYENTNYQAIRLPYKNYDIGMYVFLPAKDKKLGDFLKSINSVSLKDTIAKMSSREGTIELPRFRFNYSTTMNFDKSGDFSSMVSRESIGLSEILQRTFIEVNEEGSEAAAATRASMNEQTTCIIEPLKPFEMIVDRPFFYAIMDQNQENILFMGTVVDPNK